MPANFIQPKKSEIRKRRDAVPDNLTMECPFCHELFYRHQLTNEQECPHCGYGLRLNAFERIQLICDDFQSFDDDLQPASDWLDDAYQQKYDKAVQQTTLYESVLTGVGRIGQRSFGMGVMDAQFMMGSMGGATGEKIVRLFEYCKQQQLPVIMWTASGGARMQEKITSLMQMAKVSNAVTRFKDAGLAYIVFLTDPTTGGVTASFAMEGDFTFAEPHALVGFAGRRVIEQTINEALPPEFQRVERLQADGFVDAIIPRAYQKKLIEWLLCWLNQGGVSNESL